MQDLALQPATLADMLRLVDVGTISGKIGKQILPDLLQVMLPCSIIPTAMITCLNIGCRQMTSQKTLPSLKTCSGPWGSGLQARACLHTRRWPCVPLSRCLIVTQYQTKAN